MATPLTPQELEWEVRRGARLLPTPVNYWKGKPQMAPFCPTNLLLFHHRQAEFLLSHTPDQHHRYILIANLGGNGRMGVDARVHSLRERHSRLVFPFQTHFYSNFSSPEIDWVFITFEHVPHVKLDLLRNRESMPMSEANFICLHHLLKAWKTPSRQPTLPLHLALWLHDLTRIAEGKPAPEPMRSSVGRNEDLVERVNHLIFENRHQPLSIEVMAATLGHSVSFLRKRFQEATGRSIGRHAREVRLNQARELLHDTRLRIEEISVRCGYESLFAFSRAFRNAFGLSPTQYRKEWDSR